MRRAELLRRDGKQRIFRFPVTLRLNDSRTLASTAIDFTVISTSAREAADWVKAQYGTRPETEIEVFGPKGGRAAYRFIGWESAVFNAMLEPKSTQLELPGVQS